MEDQSNTKEVREGVMVVTYRDRPEHEREFVYVVNLRSGNHTWVAGGTDGEPHEVAARRELKEETDLDAVTLVDSGMVHTFEYDGGKGSPGEQKIFVASVDPAQEVHFPTNEITDVYWTTFEEAEGKLTFPEHIEILKALREQGLV